MSYTREGWSSPEIEDQARQFLEDVIWKTPTLIDPLDNARRVDYDDCMKRLDNIIRAAILEHEYREVYGGREEGA